MKRENGFIFLEVEGGENKAGEYADMYNFTRGQFGYGDSSMGAWDKAGDLWGQIAEIYLKENDKYSVAMAEEQFTEEQLKELEARER